MPDESDYFTANLSSQEVTFMQSGTIINERYIIRRVLGSGGMGTVYLAVDQGLPDGRPCAIKETPTPADDPPTPKQLAQINGLRIEADIMSKLAHPSIPRIFDFFPWQRRHYLVMDHIEGETLNDKLIRQVNTYHTGFDEHIVLDWALHICDLFSYLHKQEPPIIYRDCKPDNLIVTPDNELKLIDFGIARRLLNKEMRMTLLGTQGYAAPEAYFGHGDARTDIYSLGAMMHVLLTGIDPRSIEFLDWSNHRPRQYCTTLSIGLDNAVMKCLKETPADRWQSARELRDELAALAYQTEMRRRRQAATGEPGRVTGTITGRHVSHALPLTNNSHVLTPTSGTPEVYVSTHTFAPEIAWAFAAQDAIRSSPVVRDDIVYFGSYDAHMYALALATGELIGSFATNGFICSDPIVTDEAVIFGSEDGSVYAVDRALKRKQWSYATGKAIVSSPARLGDLVVIGSDNGYVYALPLSGGEPRWRFQTWGPVRGTLATLGDLVVFGSHDQRVYALDAKGNRKWICTTYDRVDAAPILYEDRVIIGSGDRHVYAIEYETGLSPWRRALDNCIFTAAAARDHKIYVGDSDGRITCLDANTGDTKWRVNVGSQITSDLVLRDHRLYFGCANGAMYCLDVRRQANIWRHLAGDAIVTRPAIVGDLVIIGSVDHYLYALRQTP